MKFHRLLPLLFLLVFSVKTSAQTVPHKLDSLLTRKLDSMRTVLNVKSLGAAMQFHDNSVWAHGSGISTLFPLDSVTPDHAYAIGSITKTITSACVLQLAQEGLLNLDDSLHKWIDTIPFINPNITIRQLLRHQSGLYDVITNPAYDAANKANTDSIWNLENLIRDYIKAPLFAPGANWSYSNTNYILLGIIIEKATGHTYYNEYKTRFFNTLGLNSMALVPYDPIPVPRAHVWLNGGGGTLADADWFFSEWISFFTSAGPAGGYFATPTDVAKWIKAFMSGQLHSPDIMTQAKTVVTAPGLPGGTKYGLGLMERTLLGQKGFGHGGDIGYSSFSLYFPGKDVSIAVLNNDQTKTSWTLVPVIQALLKVCIDYEMSVSTANPYENTDLQIQVSPNPFSENLQVSFNLPTSVAESQLVLSNSLGQTVRQKTIQNLSEGKQNLSLEQLDTLPPGVYFLSLVLNGTTCQTLKVIK